MTGTAIGSNTVKDGARPISSEGRWSLKRRMVFLLFGLVLVMWALSAVVIYHQAEKESQELFDASIAETANLLLFFSEHELAEVSPAKIAGEDKPADGQVHYLSFQLWDINGKLRYRSDNAPLTLLAPLEQEGFGYQFVDGEQIRTYNKLDNNGLFRIIVAEPMTHRREITDHFWAGLIAFSALLLPFAYFMVLWLVGKALGPVDRCVKDVNQIDPRKLDAIDSHGLPVEIAPLVDALNRGLSRIRTSINREKRFTADAAHELRTPLAGVKANVQLLAKSFKGATEEDRETVQDALTGVERCSRLISQLLALSKSESVQVSESVNEKVSLASIIKEVQALETTKADAKGIVIEWSPIDATVLGNRDALILLVRNLVSNSVNYTQPGGRVLVSYEFSPDNKLRVSVADNGPGIPVDKRADIFQRFFRLHPNQTEGSGLGLSICSEVATMHNTRLVIGEGLDGRGVSFSFNLPLSLN